MVVCPLSALAVSALIAPRLQLYTNLVCKELDGRQWDPASASIPRNVGFVGTARPVPCAADPVVQANVTKLLAGACYLALVRFSCSSFVASIVTATVQGVLSCLTAAFWGSVRHHRSLLRIWLNQLQFSDRYGRVQLLAFNIIPVLLADVVLVTLAVVPEKVPGGYWSLVFTAALEGLIGGLSLH